MLITEQKMVVVDTSVAVKWVSFSQEDGLDKADAILRMAVEKKIEIHMPELAKYEIGNVLLHKKIPAESKVDALSFFLNLPIFFTSFDSHLMKNSQEIAMSSLMTFYDASFVALARKLECPLITDNYKDQSKSKATTVEVVKLADIQI